MDFLDLLFDHEYVVNNCPVYTNNWEAALKQACSQEQGDWENVLKHFKELALSKCCMPSEYAESKLNYYFKKESDSCSLKEVFKINNKNPAFRNTIKIQILSNNKQAAISKSNLEKFWLVSKNSAHHNEVQELAKSSSPLQESCISVIIKNPIHKLDESTVLFFIKYFEDNCKKNKFINSSDFIELINTLIFSAGRDSSVAAGNFILSILYKSELKDALKSQILDNFLKYKEEGFQLDKSVETKLEEVISSQEILNSVANHVAENDSFIPNILLLSKFEELIENKKYFVKSLNAIERILKDCLENPRVDFGIKKVEQTLVRLISKNHYPSSKFLNYLMDYYFADHTSFNDVIFQTIADIGNLSDKIDLNKLVEPVLKNLSTSKNVDQLKKLIFILDRLALYHVKLPENILDELKRFDEIKDIKLNRLINHLKQAITGNFSHEKRDISIDDIKENFVKFQNAWLGVKGVTLSEDLQRILVKSVGTLFSLGWSSESVVNLVKKVKQENLIEFINLIENLADYKVLENLFDRNGSTAGEIIVGGKISKLDAKIQQLIRDNHFYVKREIHELNSEIITNNQLNEYFRTLAQEGFYINSLDQIDKLYDELKSEDGIILKNWDKEDLLKWSVSQKKQPVTDKNILEITAVIGHAVKLHKKFYPRAAQLISVLSLYKSNGGGLAQIATGEGKSLIIAMWSSICALNGKTVDIVTSSYVLAQRDAEEWRDFYASINITSDHNIYTSSSIKDCYNKDIVYGDTLHFIGDDLRDKTNNVKNNRVYEVLIVDEVDNLFIDKSNMKVQLSSHIPSMEYLNALLLYAYGVSKFSYIGLEYNEETGTFIRTENGASVEIKDVYDYMKNYTSTFLTENLYDATTKNPNATLIVPKHLKNFAASQLPVWMSSLESAYHYTPYVDYYVGYHFDNSKLKNTKIVAPIDVRGTGEVQLSLKLSNGLHPLLEAKNGVAMSAEALISIFQSYPGYFKKYQGSIYGLTGTLGKKPHHDFLREIFGSDNFVIPEFIHKDLTIFDPIQTETREEWLLKIVSDVKRKISHKRAALIILETLRDVDDVYKKFIEQGYDNSKIKIFSVGSGEQQEKFQEIADVGDVVIATNLAGRGADLKLSNSVVKNGGLHVIVGSYPDSSRVEMQAYGRAARKGEPGSAQLILGPLAPEYEQCNQDISCIEKVRDENEAIRLKENELCQIPSAYIKDAVFDKFLDLLAFANSPTGYQVELKKPSPENLESAKIYVYLENGSLWLEISDANKKTEKFEIDERINLLDPKSASHIISMINSGGKLNGQDLNVIDFISAYEFKFTNYPKITQRMNDLYMHEVLNSFPSEVKEFEAKLKEDKGNSLKRSEFFKSTLEPLYLTKLLLESDEFKHLIPQDFNPNSSADFKPDSELLKKVKYIKFFKLWQQDRNLYNRNSEISQVKESFGVFMRSMHHHFSQIDDNCDINSEEKIIKTKANNERIKNLVLAEFDKFYNRILEDKNIIKNPAYLVQKSISLMNVYFNQQQEGIFSREVNKWKEAEPEGYWGSFMNYLTKTFFGDNYDIPYPLKSAKEAAVASANMDNHFVWPANLYAAYIALIEALTIVNEKQAEEAVAVTNEVARHLQRIIVLLQEEMDSLQSQITFELSMGIASRNDDLVLQHIGLFEVYKAFQTQAIKNLDILSQANSKQIARIASYFTLEQMARVNLTSASFDKFGLDENGNPKSLGEDQQNNENNSTKLPLANLSDAEKLRLMSFSANYDFPGKNQVMEQFSAQGVSFWFTIELEQLHKEKKHWFGTALGLIMGVAQIAIGIMTAGAASPFMLALSQAMIMNGIADIIGSVESMITGIPIDVHNYMKSKGVSYAISLITAGVAQIGSSLGILNAPVPMDPLDSLLKGVSASVGTRILSETIKHATKDKIIKPDDVLHYAEEKIQQLIANHAREFQRIFTSDSWKSGFELQAEIQSYAQNFMKEYQSKFNDKGTRIATGVLGNVASMFMGGSYPALGNALSFAAGTGVGAIKTYEAADRFVSHMSGVIKQEASKAQGTKEMMRWVLVRDHGEGVAAALMTAMEQQSFVVGGDIKYGECSQISGMSLPNEYVNYRKAMLIDCEAINRAMQESHGKETERMKAYLSGVVADNLKVMLQNQVMDPLSNAAGGLAWSKIIDYLNSYSPEYLKEQEEKLKEAAKPHAKKFDEMQREAAKHLRGENAENDADSGGKKPKKTKVYGVKSGDTLSEIAKANGVSVADILKANPDIDNPDVIKAGQKIIIPYFKTVAPESIKKEEPEVKNLAPAPEEKSWWDRAKSWLGMGGDDKPKPEEPKEKPELKKPEEKKEEILNPPAVVEKKYIVKIHHDFHVKDGKKQNDIGHFYVEFVGEGIDDEKRFFGQNPAQDGLPFSDGLINDEMKRYNKALGSDSKPYTKEIYLTEEQFKSAYAHALKRQANPEPYKGHIGHDCIDFTQQIYRSAGQVGDFVDLYTKKELNDLGSWAATSAEIRYGAGDQYQIVEGSSVEDVAKRYNVPIERIIVPTMDSACIEGVCFEPHYKIIPAKQKDNSNEKNR